MYHVIEELFEQFINYATLLAEFAGVLVLLYTLIFCFIQWCRRKPDVRLKLAEGIATALEFKMCGEVLRTVVIRQWEGLLLLGAIFALREQLIRSTSRGSRPRRGRRPGRR